MTANELTKQIIEYCILSGHYVSRINNTPSRRRKGTVKKGVPDILGCDKYGKALGIEVKTTDKQSKDQIKYQEEIEKRGGTYILAHSLEDVTERI